MRVAQREVQLTACRAVLSVVCCCEQRCPQQPCASTRIQHHPSCHQAPLFPPTEKMAQHHSPCRSVHPGACVDQQWAMRTLQYPLNSPSPPPPKRNTHPVSRVHLGAGIDQQLGHVQQASLDRHMQGGGAFAVERLEAGAAPGI